MTTNENKLSYEGPPTAIRDPDFLPHGPARAMHWRGFGNGFLAAAVLAVLMTILIATKVVTFSAPDSSGRASEGPVPPPNSSVGIRTNAPIASSGGEGNATGLIEEVGGRGRQQTPGGGRELSD